MRKKRWIASAVAAVAATSLGTVALPATAVAATPASTVQTAPAWDFNDLLGSVGLGGSASGSASGEVTAGVAGPALGGQLGTLEQALASSGLQLSGATDAAQLARARAQTARILEVVAGHIHEAMPGMAKQVQAKAEQTVQRLQVTALMLRGCATSATTGVVSTLPTMNNETVASVLTQVQAATQDPAGSVGELQEKATLLANDPTALLGQLQGEAGGAVDDLTGTLGQLQDEAGSLANNPTGAAGKLQGQLGYTAANLQAAAQLLQTCASEATPDGLEAAVANADMKLYQTFWQAYAVLSEVQSMDQQDVLTTDVGDVLDHEPLNSLVETDAADALQTVNGLTR